MNLSSSIGVYLGGGFFALFVLFQILRAAANEISKSRARIDSFALLVMGITAGGGFLTVFLYVLWRRNRRLQSLDPVLQEFYRIERRNRVKESFRAIAIGIPLCVAALTLIPWTAILIISPLDSGLARPLMISLYLLLIGVTIWLAKIAKREMLRSRGPHE